MDLNTVGGVYYYETEELALKGNNDYKNILQAMVILESQKTKARKDLQLLKDIEEKALHDPFKFLEDFQDECAVKFPIRQKLHLVPAIDWGKYALDDYPSEFAQRQMRYIQLSKQKYDKAKGQDKSENSWSLEDQVQLEKLLLFVPDEEVETHRWEKIAKSMRKTSPYQVAQKAYEYYEISNRKNLNFPGKVPDLNNLAQIWGLERNINSSDGSVDEKTKNSDYEDIDSDLWDTPEYQELVVLEKLLKRKTEPHELIQHIGFKCCVCKCEPIIGIRWHCVDCEMQISFCEDCVNCPYTNDDHSLAHNLEEATHKSATYLDKEYLRVEGAEYDYLDPNYLPGA